MTANFENGRALVVGISGYINLPNLPDAVLNDVDDMADLLCSPDFCGYSQSKVRVLRDSTGIASTIRSALSELAQASEADTVLFVFSGHGERIVGGPFEGSYLCPADFDPDDALATGIPCEELSRLLAQVAARRLVVILDACHAAGTMEVKSAKDVVKLKSGFSQADFEKLGVGAGRVLLASSREDEYSLIKGGMRNSLFMHHVLSGLRGGAHRGDGTVRIFDLFDYISGNIREEDQHPVFKAQNVEDNFPIALSSQPAEIGVRITSVASEEWWSEFEQVAVKLYPRGPEEQDVWSRAGADVSILRPGLNGKGAWHSALRQMRLGGGGDQLRLLQAIRSDFPANADLDRLDGERSHANTKQSR
ncbi:hypothetical protein HNQ36_002774 [Afipia massiliensis]|uniref:Caspase family protein n=1 Tax=Afipia massiliensis TaxID=211460 RepID=A0A840N171_9BRAD|nr:caspase family protein [Afipia massiliensis]MBB5052800.1 hypothetical protein [Afipia massiliensis]